MGEEPSPLHQSRNADEVCSAAAEKHRKTTRYLKLVKNIALYALTLWGLYAIALQGMQKAHPHVHNVENIHREHQRDNMATSEPENEHRHHHSSDSQMPLTFCDCNLSITEALNRGCKYDSLAATTSKEH
jgi:ABC-type nickel/cobalt efflux system permease component RcnA